MSGHPLHGPLDPGLVAQYRELHGLGLFPGWSVLGHAWEIKRLIDRTRARTLLDYGCGEGRQYEVERVHDWWCVPRPDCYDPAVPGFEALPDRIYDGVICCDVVEHLPESLVAPTLELLFRRARQWVFVGTCCRGSDKRLPDGRDVHLTVRDRAWWGAQMTGARARVGAVAVTFEIRFTP